MTDHVTPAKIKADLHTTRGQPVWHPRRVCRARATGKDRTMTDAPERIWAWVDYDGSWDGKWLADSVALQPERLPDAEYLRADLVPRWSDDMDAAPKDGTRVLTFHPANPKAIIDRARQDNIVLNEWRDMSWYRFLPEQPPTRWMRVDPPPSDVKG